MQARVPWFSVSVNRGTFLHSAPEFNISNFVNYAVVFFAQFLSRYGVHQTGKIGIDGVLESG